MHKLDLNSQVKQKQSIYSSNIDDEAVMLNVEIGKYFGMNPIATDIWQKITAPTSIKSLIAELTSEYDISEEDCQKDVMLFLEKLMENGLIESFDHESA